jgi:hypothetical protein
MTRRPALTTLAVLAAFVAATAVVLTLRADPAPGSVAYPARLMAVTTEFRLTLSRIKVPAGRVRIELANYGEDPHDLKLRRIGGTRVYTIPETAPGERTTRTFRLQAGRYRVWCAVADHQSLGMRAPLRAFRD